MFLFDVATQSRLTYEERLREAERERMFAGTGTRLASQLLRLAEPLIKLFTGKLAPRVGTSPQPTPAR